MKKIFFLLSLLAVATLSWAQTYPAPEFSNEVYLFEKRKSLFPCAAWKKIQQHSKLKQV